MTQHPVLRGLLAAALLGLFVPASLAADDSKKADQARADIRETSQETLDRLYKEQPEARKAIARAAGYATFSNFGMKILLAGGGSGKGLAYNNKTKATTYMKMVEVQAGLGMGVKKFRLVWVFDNQADFDSFVNSGWEFGAQATAAATTGGKGDSLAGAMSIKPGVWLYQLTDDGLAAELTAKGTKYYKDGDLN